MAIMPIERGKIREYATATAAARPAYLDDPKAPVPPTHAGETLQTAERLSDVTVKRTRDVPALARQLPAAPGA